MARKTEIDTEVAALKERLSAGSKSSDSKTNKGKNKTDNSSRASGKTAESATDDDLDLEDVVSALKEHGLDVEDLKEIWDQITAELKDLSVKRPLVTALGAFLIGYAAGRMSRK